MGTEFVSYEVEATTSTNAFSKVGIVPWIKSKTETTLRNSPTFANTYKIPNRFVFMLPFVEE